MAGSKSVSLLSISRLTLRIGTHCVLHDVTMTVGRGEIVAVVGESGCGKSTLLRAVIGILPDGGIIDGGEDADLPDGSDPRYPARTGIAVAAASTTDWLLQYLDDQGVNDTNVAFYLGTHAHSDHIANADEIIYK